MGKYETLFNLNLDIQNIGGKVLSLKRLPFILREKTSISRNIELFSKKKNDVCYILGLGPSLKEIDLSKLNGDTIATNRFYKYDTSHSIDPTFYLMMDNDFFLNKEKQCLIDAKRQYPHSAFILNGKYHAEAEGIVGSDSVYYMYSWNGMFSGKKIDFCKLLPAFGNIVCCAIGFAMGLGYKKITLLGCDFNSFATQKVQHCYSEDKNAPKLRSLASELFNYSFEAEMHNRLAKYATEQGIQVLNGTPNSLIDSYPFLTDIEQSEISK